MAAPLTVSIPHSLGRAEALSRLKSGLEGLPQAGLVTVEQQAWADNKMTFLVRALGQSVPGSLEVLDDAVRLEVTSSKNVCHVLDRPGQLIRIDETGTVSKPVNWKDMPGRDAADFDVAFPFVGTTPQIEPLPTTTRDGVIEAAFPESEPKACANTEKPKIQKADDDEDKPKKKSKKRQASNDEDYTPPRKVVKRKKYEEPREDYGEGGARGMDIIIRGGMGGGYRPGGYGGGGRGMGGMGGGSTGYGGK